MELNGVIRDDFWSGAGAAEDERRAFQRYAEVSLIFGTINTRISRFQESAEAARVRALDRLTFAQTWSNGWACR